MQIVRIKKPRAKNPFSVSVKESRRIEDGIFVDARCRNIRAKVTFTSKQILVRRKVVGEKDWHDNGWELLNMKDAFWHYRSKEMHLIFRRVEKIKRLADSWKPIEPDLSMFPKQISETRPA